MELSRMAECLTDELKRLVGWGAQPKRLPLLPILRELAGVGDASYTAAGYIVRAYLISSISRVTGPICFEGRAVSAEVFKRAVRLLLEIEGSGKSAPNRRYRAMTVLGCTCSVDKWRRPFGPERELLRLLAEHMVKDA